MQRSSGRGSWVRTTSMRCAVAGTPTSSRSSGPTRIERRHGRARWASRSGRRSWRASLTTRWSTSCTSARPTHTHVEIASAALDAGKHVLVEKPVALNLADADALAARAEAAGLHAGVALTYRGYPMVRRARAARGRRHAGTLRLVHGGYIQDWLADAADYNWRLEPDLGGASRAVADIGSHWFDTAEFISGCPIVEVFADLATFMPTRWRPANGGTAFSPATSSEDESPSSPRMPRPSSSGSRAERVARAS